MSRLRAVVYDSPVLSIRARTRRLKSALLVMVISCGLPTDPQQRVRQPTLEAMKLRPRGGPPFASAKSPAGAGCRRFGVDGRRPQATSDPVGRTLEEILGRCRIGVAPFVVGARGRPPGVPRAQGTAIMK